MTVAVDSTWQVLTPGVKHTGPYAVELQQRSPELHPGLQSCAETKAVNNSKARAMSLFIVVNVLVLKLLHYMSIYTRTDLLRCYLSYWICIKQCKNNILSQVVCPCLVISTFDCCATCFFDRCAISNCDFA